MILENIKMLDQANKIISKIGGVVYKTGKPEEYAQIFSNIINYHKNRWG